MAKQSVSKVIDFIQSTIREPLNELAEKSSKFGEDFHVMSMNEFWAKINTKSKSPEPETWDKQTVLIKYKEIFIKYYYEENRCILAQILLNDEEYSIEFRDFLIVNFESHPMTSDSWMDEQNKLFATIIYDEIAGTDILGIMVIRDYVLDAARLSFNMSKNPAKYVTN